VKLPNNTKAYIPKEKLTHYLFSEVHIVGKYKAKFFRSIGYNESNITLFTNELQNFVRTNEVKEAITSTYGIKYIIDGELKTPSGITIKVRTIWIIEKDKRIPRFVTVYPV
jgi:hypothetical protein